MNKFKLIMGCCISAAVLFAGCSNDSDQPGKGSAPRAIVLKSTVADLSTKAFNPNVQIADQQKVGVFIEEDAASPATNYDPNLLYTANGTGGLTTTTDQNFPANGAGVKISAYHPYNDGAADSYEFSVAADQSVNENYYNSDLLYSAKTAYASSPNALGLSFKHLLSKVSYTITNAEDYSDIVVELQGAQINTGFNRTTGEVTPPATVNTSDVTLNATYGAVVIPQTIAVASQVFKVTADGDTFYSKALADNLVFASGKRYNYNITITEAGLIIASEEISDWNVDNGVIEGGTSLAAPKVTFSPSFTELGNYVVLEGRYLDMVESVTFAGQNVTFSEKSATSIKIDLSAITGQTTGDIVFNGSATPAVTGFTVYNSLIKDGNFENVTELPAFTNGKTASTTANEYQWVFACESTAEGTAEVLNESGVQNSYINMNMSKPLQYWHNSYIGQRFRVTEKAKYKLSFKVKATSTNSANLTDTRVYAYIAAETTSSAGTFIVKENSFGQTGFPYGQFTGIPNNEWKEYSQVFDFNYWVPTSVSYTTTDKVVESGDFSDKIFTLVIRAGDKAGTYDIDDVLLVKVVE